MANFTTGDLQLEKVSAGDTNWKLIEDDNKQKIDDGVTSLNRRFGGEFSSKNSIKAIVEARREDGTIVKLTNVTPYRLFIFHANDAAVANDDTILQPDTGSGRWREFSASSLSIDQIAALSVSGANATNPFATENSLKNGYYANDVSDIAALRAITSAERQDYQWRFVVGESTDYFFDPTETSSDDSDLIITPADITEPAPGRWHKREVASGTQVGIQGGGSSVQEISGETLSKFTVVRIDQATQKLFHADVSQAELLDSILGVVDSNYNADETANVIVTGFIQDPSFSFQTGLPIYFDESGALTQTEPETPNVKIAIAVDTNLIYMKGIQSGIQGGTVTTIGKKYSVTVNHDDPFPKSLLTLPKGAAIRGLSIKENIPFVDFKNPNVALLIHSDNTPGSNTFLDESLYNHVLSPQGNVKHSAESSVFGKTAIKFDGNDAIFTSDSLQFTLGSNDFTFELWAKRSGGFGSFQYLFGQSDSSFSVSTQPIHLHFDGNNRPEVMMWGNGLVQITSTESITDNSWHHYAVTRNLNTLRLFVDGEEKASQDVTGFVPNDSNNNFALGGIGEFPNERFIGLIDEFLFLNGIAQYTGNFTPPIRENSPNLAFKIGITGNEDTFVEAVHVVGSQEILDFVLGESFKNGGVLSNEIDYPINIDSLGNAVPTAGQLVIQIETDEESDFVLGEVPTKKLVDHNMAIESAFWDASSPLPNTLLNLPANWAIENVSIRESVPFDNLVDADTLFLLQSDNQEGSQSFKDESSFNLSIQKSNADKLNSHTTAQSLITKTSILMNQHFLVTGFPLSDNPLDTAQDPITVELSVRFILDSGTSPEEGIFSLSHSNQKSILLKRNGSDLELLVSSDGASYDVHNLLSFFSGQVQKDVWFHIALTYDGSVAKVFVNGNLEATSSPFAMPSFSRGLVIGAAEDPSNLNLTAYIQQIRFSKGVRYTNSFTPPTELFRSQLSYKVGTTLQKDNILKGIVPVGSIQENDFLPGCTLTKGGVLNRFGYTTLQIFNDGFEGTPPTQGRLDFIFTLVKQDNRPVLNPLVVDTNDKTLFVKKATISAGIPLPTTLMQVPKNFAIQSINFNETVPFDGLVDNDMVFLLQSKGHKNGERIFSDESPNRMPIIIEKEAGVISEPSLDWSSFRSILGETSLFFEGGLGLKAPHVSSSMQGTLMDLRNAFDSVFTSGSWTIEAWFNTITIAGISSVLSFDEQALEIRRDADSLKLGLSSGGGSWDIANLATIDTGLNVAQWYHVAVVHEGSEYRVYLDGLLKSTISGAPPINSNPKSIRVGNNHLLDSGFEGFIDQIRVSKKARYAGASFSVPAEYFSTYRGFKVGVAGADDKIASEILPQGNTQPLKFDAGEWLENTSILNPLGSVDLLMNTLNFDGPPNTQGQLDITITAILQEGDQTPISIDFQSLVAGIVPIGTIQPWHKSLPGIPPLPSEWAECNGQILNDPESPFHNQTIPDLNNEARFLRGGALSGVMQDDQMQSHKHNDAGHSHSDAGHSHTQNQFFPFGGHWFGAGGVTGGSEVKGGTVQTRNANANIQNASANLGDPSDSGTGAETPRHGDETRPKNMSVVWIIRIK